MVKTYMESINKKPKNNVDINLKTTVIIPTLNEEDNITLLLDLITELYEGISIIVSDDGSLDLTRKKVIPYSNSNARIKLIDRSRASVRGLTASVMDAIMKVETEYFIVMDGDLQHPPEYIALLLEKLSQEFDLVVGIRDDIVRKWKLLRIISQKVAAALGSARLLFKGIIIKDPMSGFFGAKTSICRALIEKKQHRFVKGGYKILFDMLKILPDDISIGGVRFEFSRRKHGSSKVNAKVVFCFFKSLLT